MSELEIEFRVGDIVTLKHSYYTGFGKTWQVKKRRKDGAMSLENVDRPGEVYEWFFDRELVAVAK